MNEKDLELEDLSLEEIMREFGSTMDMEESDEGIQLQDLIDEQEEQDVPEDHPVQEEWASPALDVTTDLLDMLDEREAPKAKPTRALKDTRDLIGMFDDPEEPEVVAPEEPAAEPAEVAEVPEVPAA